MARRYQRVDLPRSSVEILRVLELAVAASRRDREEWGAYGGPDSNESYRRSGLQAAAHWLSDEPVPSTGPLTDGPASSLERVRSEYELALRLIPDGVDRHPRYAPSPGPGSRQRWQAEVLGIAQLLAWALDDTDEIPGFVAIPRATKQPMPTPAILWQPNEQVLSAYAIAVAVYETDPSDLVAKGAVAAGQWLLALTPATPITGQRRYQSARRARLEARAAIAAARGHHPGIDPDAALGAAAMLAYALGMEDSKPVEMTEAAFDRILAKRRD